MNRRSARTAILSTKPWPLAIAALLGTAGLASTGGAAEPPPSETDRPARLTTRQLHQQLGKPARFSITTGDPDAPTSWRYGASRDPNTWERVPLVVTDREDIVAIRFNGRLTEEDHTRVPFVVFDITDRQVEILAKLPTLRSLTLIEAGITAEQLRTLSSLPQLQVLALEGCHISNVGLQWIGQMKELRSLTMHRARIDPAGVKYLESLRNLVRLDLVDAHLDDTILAGLSALTWLRFLRLEGVFTDAGIAHLAPLESLEGLHVGQGNAEGTGLKHLRPDTLRELTLRRTVSDEGLSAVARFTHLRTLTISGPNATDKGIAELGNLRSLESLNAAYTTIKGAGLQHLTALKRADFENAGITSEGIRSFAGLVELEYLGLNGTRIDGDALTHLRGLRTLVRLDARRTKIGNESLRDLDSLHSLEHLDLTACSELDDGAAPFLGKMTSLKYLELEDTKLTEVALPHFKGLRNLKGLSFPDKSGNVRDSEEFKSLRRALPELRIHLWPCFGR